MKIKITKLNKKDIDHVARIASESFSGLRGVTKGVARPVLAIAVKWVRGNFLNFPRFLYFVARDKKNIFGYILWQEKGGFRKESVWELEQIAVVEKFRGQGIAKELIVQSLAEIKKYLAKRGAKLKLVEITTGVENKAQNLYKKTLGAKPECVIRDFFRGDEVVMISRRV